jgi:putative transposase
MPNYRRARVPGARYFFTVALADRDSDALVANINSLRAALRIARKARPFAIDAIVVLPDHLHCIWTLPEGDSDFALRWAHAKTLFAQNIEGGDSLRRSQRNRRELGIWQRRFWEHLIRNDEDYRRHVDYIHFNPVKHRWAESPGVWPFSSFQVFVARGIYDGNWGTRSSGASAMVR